MKFAALKEYTASIFLPDVLTNLYSRATTGRDALSASGGAKGLQPVISTFNGILGSASVTVANGKRVAKLASRNRGSP